MDNYCFRLDRQFGAGVANRAGVLDSMAMENERARFRENLHDINALGDNLLKRIELPGIND